MVQAGCWGKDHCQLHRFFPWKDIKIHEKAPYSIQASDCYASDTRLTGKPLTNSVFDIGGGRPKIYFVPLNRILLGSFYYEGHSYEFNFSKFWTGCKTRFSCKETDTEILWHVRQENRQVLMETKIRCRKSDMLLVNYEAPDGTKRHNRLWNGGNETGRIWLYRKEISIKPL